MLTLTLTLELTKNEVCRRGILHKHMCVCVCVCVSSIDTKARPWAATAVPSIIVSHRPVISLLTMRIRALLRVSPLQGITLKMNDLNHCIVARIMHGGMIHRQGNGFNSNFIDAVRTHHCWLRSHRIPLLSQI